MTSAGSANERLESLIHKSRIWRVELDVSDDVEQLLNCVVESCFRLSLARMCGGSVWGNVSPTLPDDPDFPSTSPFANGSQVSLE